VIWEADGEKWPTFHCSHAHCHGRKIEDVMSLWGDADRFCGRAYTAPGPSYNDNGHQAAPESEPVRTQAKWPKELAAAAFHGITGDVVKAIEPHTEADSASLLMQFLAFAGNAIGRKPHAKVEGDDHHLNLNVAIVGDTSKSRKGTSSGRIKQAFSLVDAEWTARVQYGGLSSGEGLIWAVRDPISKEVKEKDGTRRTETVDSGIEDKRLLVLESEFASTLKVMAREGNTLSPLIRQAWDNGNLSTLTKNSPAKATDAHISIIGHITKGELLRYLNDVEAGNGFANRFMWSCSKRARVLPEGGGQVDYQALVPRLCDSLRCAREIGLVERDDEARRAWAEIYGDLSEGRPGLFGSVTARAEAQVLRLSVLYAVLDGESVVRLPHLEAATAVWEYCEDSARYIFGDATGDPVADRIIEALRSFR
jgi:hypothetical protein